jgi:hypothetical protein
MGNWAQERALLERARTAPKRSHHLVKPPTTHSTNREPNELEQKKGGRKIDEN